QLSPAGIARGGNPVRDCATINGRLWHRQTFGFFEEERMETTRLTRRTLMQSAAAAATLAGAPFVRGAHAAGKLSVAVWDHWVPGANDVLEKLSREWAAKEKVDLTIDFVTSQGDKL